MILDINWIVPILVCLFILLDLLTGFTQAIVNHELDSKVMKTGLLHKCGFILAMIFGYLCEESMTVIDLGYQIPLGSAVCVYIIMTEIISITENLGKISPELANSKFLELFKQHND